jgi:hypothetical protein
VNPVPISDKNLPKAKIQTCFFMEMQRDHRFIVRSNYLKIKKIIFVILII